MTTLRLAATPLVMGVVNVTPDSFSDGGRWATRDAAVAHGLALLAEGADILDVGGESTRPGAVRPEVEDELARVVPVVRALAEAGATVSVDTMRAVVAEQALTAGASIVNDVSGGLADPDVPRVAAGHGATYVAMHWRAHAAKMADFATYDDPGGVVAAVRAELAERVDAVLTAGVTVDRLVLDPGLGFAKTGPQNWRLIAGLAGLADLGYPVLVGASRKSFLGALLAAPAPDGGPIDAPVGDPRPADQRDQATAALSVILAQAGVWGVRVHDVRSTRDALAVWQAVTAAVPATDGPAAREVASRG